MGNAFLFILMWATALIMLLAVYKLCFSGTTLHRFNRCYLLGATVLSAIIPFVRLSVPKTTITPIHETTFAHMLQEVTIYGGTAAPDELSQSPAEFSWAWLLVGCWAVYVIVLVTGWTRSIIKTRRFLEGKRVHRLGHIRVVSHDEEFGPFSWMNYIVISNAENGFARRASIRHEVSHIRLGHYADLVFLLACTIVNPVCWLIMKEIKIVHEYEADNEVTGRYGLVEKDYQRLLIMRTVGAEAYALASSFNLNIKQRIIMMKKEKTKKRRMLYLLAVIPVLGAMSLLCGNNVDAAGLQIGAGSDDTNSEKVINILIDHGISYNLPDIDPLAPFTQVGNAKELGKIIRDRNIRKAILTIGEDEKIESVSAVKDILRENECLEIVYSTTLVNGQEEISEDIMDKIMEEMEDEQKKIEEQIANDEPIMQPEIMPEFPGGTMALMQYLQTNIKYPAEARDNNIQGRVIIQFIVSKDGSIAEAKVVKSVHELLDQEALRMVSGMPNWTPGTHNGNAVRVAYSIPINFRIPDDEYHSISLYYYKEMQMMLFKSNTRPANQALNVSSGNLDNAIGELIRGQREFIEMDYTHDNYQNIQRNLQDHGIERIKYEVEKVQ